MSAAKSSTATGTIATADQQASRPRGRFAPSPTGRLHVGSLYTAVGSWLDARAAGGEWLVRIEDVDRAREVPGAVDDILRTLEAFGLYADGPAVRQSERGELYADALARLEAAGLVYPCSCTRGAIPAPPGGGEARYPGTCRSGPRRPDGPRALRLRTDGWIEPVSVVDRLQGTLTQQVDREIGDFVLRRRDGYWAYQLAVVVDDAAQGITDVVRGLDLWDNTPRQRLLQLALGLPAPRYLHLPLVCAADGAKLAKSRQSIAVDPGTAGASLTAILTLLGCAPPPDLAGAAVGPQLAWAMRHWTPRALAGRTSVPVPPAAGDARDR